uniref:Uncharacterized protein n=1 Tax=Anopheles culicifacies TaxID=139723 RepID=A0A182MBJ0_9DIPT
MMRISQSDNSLLMSAAAAAARATTGDRAFASGTVTTHTNGLMNTNYRDTSGEDEADAGSLMTTGETEHQYNVTGTSALPATRVRRSQSVDSALNRGTEQHGLGRSGTSRSVTRSRAAANLQQPAVIYEMDSEDEERFLASETDLILGTTTTAATRTTTNTGRIRGRARAITAGGGGLVQTLRKSYSLSDLSEPDTQRTQDEVDEIVNRPQRVLRSKSSRSSSGSRQMEMYFPEVEIAGAPYHATAAPPYNYIRSSDDISSGYSSAEPGLSRTASMSNTARPRLKSKTREDQDEYGADVFYDEQNVFYADGNHEEPMRSGSYVPQRASIYELNAGSTTLPAITQAGHTMETAAASPTYSSGGSQSAQRIGNVPPEMNDKYKLFMAWMEEQQKRERELEQESTRKDVSNDTKHEDSNMSQQETGQGTERPLPGEQELVASVKQEELESSSIVPSSKSSPEAIVTGVEPAQDDLSAMDDNFMDTISVSSNENDEFLEVEVTTESTADLSHHEEEEKEQQQKDTVMDNPVEDVKEEAPESVATTEEVIGDPEMESNIKQEAIELPSVIEETEQQQPQGIVIEEDNLPKDVTTDPDSSSNLMVASCSSSNLTSSSSSLAVSEGSTGSVINLAIEGAPGAVPGKKHPSFGKQRKAPPIPPSPEMIVIREPSKSVPTVTPPRPPVPSNPPNGEGLAEKRSVPVNPRTATGGTTTTTTTTPASSEKSKPKKFMSSLTGMFKGHGGDAATSSNRSNESAPSQPSMGHPKETEI